jgi:DNA topoisomerase-1
VHPVVAQDINDYVRERTGESSPRRTSASLHGTVAAAVSLAEHGPEPRKILHRVRAIAPGDAGCVDGARKHPTIAHARAVISPRLIDRYVADATIDPEAVEFLRNRAAPSLFE